MKKLLLNFTKIIVTAALFYIILKDQNISEIVDSMLTADAMLFVSAILVFLSVFVVFAYRWRLVNSIYDIDINIIELIKDYLIAYALNNVLPSSIGGDVWRMKQLKDVTLSKSKSIMIPIIERISGFVAVILLAPVSFVYFTQYDIGKPFIALLSLIIVLLILLFSENLLKVIDNFFLKRLSEKMSKNWNSLRDVIHLIQKKKLTFSKAVILSASTQMLFAYSSKLILNSLNIEIAYLEMLSIIPLIYVVTIIPISINGFGIREKFMTDAFIHFQISPELAIAGAFLISLNQIIVGLIGTLVILLSKKKSKI